MKKQYCTDFSVKPRKHSNNEKYLGILIGKIYCLFLNISIDSGQVETLEQNILWDSHAKTPVKPSKLWNMDLSKMYEKFR